MTTHAYTEDQLVEQPAIGLFAELGWQTVSALEEIFDKDAGTLRRETPGDVVLESRLRAALSTLNPNLPVEAFGAAVVELTRDRGYNLVLDKSGNTLNGVPGVVFAPESVDITSDILKIINKDKPLTAEAPKPAEKK